ncbi:MAG TPA: M20 family metallopeptidase [Candidatus Blautia merdavium]|uniref:M20 family metallopeptidase n=1 Tax=Candidatus Blautia merdavium TaxID=2838494 RepID=A0A9D2PR02_9FIRM|nr:M20 family metallopeptidase [Candidatus Blautia merdavium]
MNANLNWLEQYIERNRDEMLEFWKDLVNLQGYSKETERVNQVIERVKLEFERNGFHCRRESSQGNADVLIGILGEDRKKEPLIFTGHVDTVFPQGSFEESPFYIEGNHAFGPGVMDMKGGIVIALYAAKALNELHYEERPLKIIFVGDEEIGHTESISDQIIAREAAGAVCAFNLEPGRMDDCLTVGRKGNIDCHVTVHGIGGHVGNAFLQGRNAIEEMAHKIIQLQSLTDYKNGNVVSVDVIEGGTVSNAIPDRCKVEIDCRFLESSQMEVIKNQIQKVCSKTYIDGTVTEVDFVNSMPAFESTDRIMSLYHFINTIAQENSLQEYGYKIVGGNSDAAYISQVGTPVICSCGVKGDKAHTKQEYAFVDSLFERTKLFVLVILEFHRFERM